MSEPFEVVLPQVVLVQAVCDGIYLYGLCSDSTLWVSRIEFPLAWRQLPAVPNNEVILSIGVTLGAVKDLPAEALFAVADKTGNLYFFDGSVWTQESGPS